MIKNLVVTPPQLGRITIGSVVEKNGKFLPVKSDAISVTGNSQDGGTRSWGEHPVMKEIRAGKPPEDKIRVIPVRVMFDSIQSNMTTDYTVFDTNGRQVCVGDGETCRRRQNDGVVETMKCPGPTFCSFGKTNRCKLYARAMFSIDAGGLWEQNPTAGFTLRTTGWNSTKQLVSQLSTFRAACGGKLAGFPAFLVLRAKSTSMSMRSTFFYLDLVPRVSLADSVAEVLRHHGDMAEKGVNWEAVEQSIADGLSQSPFVEDGGDEGEGIVQEFFSSSENIDRETGEIKQGQGQDEAPPPLTPEQEAALVAALAAKGRTVEQLNAWLHREPGSPLALMKPAEYERAAKEMGVTL